MTNGYKALSMCAWALCALAATVVVTGRIAEVSRSADCAKIGGAVNAAGVCLPVEKRDRPTPIPTSWSEYEAWDVNTPIRIVPYEQMLYPQQSGWFARKISPETWAWLQKKAREELENTPYAHPDVIAHWQSIADGKVPFGFTVDK